MWRVWRYWYGHRVLVEKPQGKGLLGRPGHRWRHYVKTELHEIGWVGTDWINMGRIRIPVVESREHSNEFSCSTKHKEYLFQVRNYQFLKEDCSMELYPKTVQALYLVMRYGKPLHISNAFLRKHKDIVFINLMSWVKTDGLRNFVAINAVCNISMDGLFDAPSK